MADRFVSVPVVTPASLVSQALSKRAGDPSAPNLRCARVVLMLLSTRFDLKRSEVAMVTHAGSVFVEGQQRHCIDLLQVCVARFVSSSRVFCHVNVLL